MFKKESKETKTNQTEIESVAELDYITLDEVSGGKDEKHGCVTYCEVKHPKRCMDICIQP